MSYGKQTQVHLYITDGVKYDKLTVSVLFSKYKDLLQFLPDDIKPFAQEFDFFFFLGAEQQHPNDKINVSKISKNDSIFIYYRNKSLKNLQFNKPLENKFFFNDSILEFESKDSH